MKERTVNVGEPMNTQELVDEIKRLEALVEELKDALCYEGICFDRPCGRHEWCG